MFSSLKKSFDWVLTLESDFQKLAWRLNARWAKRSTTWGSPNQTIQRGLFLPLTTLASLQPYYTVLFLQNCCCSGRQIVFRRGPSVKRHLASSSKRQRIMKSLNEYSKAQVGQVGQDVSITFPPHSVSFWAEAYWRLEFRAIVRRTAKGWVRQLLVRNQ